MTQITLDFSKRPPPSDPGKLLSSLSFRCSEELHEFLDLLAHHMGTDRSKLIHRYVVEGMTRDLAGRLLAQPHLNESLAEIIRQGFL